MRRFIALLTAAVCLALLVGACAARAARPTIRYGDRGRFVTLWQQRLNVWLRQSGHVEVPVTGYFGDRTLAATNDLQRFTGIPLNRVVSDRTRAELYEEIVPVQDRRYEWPLPLPHWYWSWARWYMSGREQASRPNSAPYPVPDWAWRRLSAQLRHGLIDRARAYVLDWLQTKYGAGTIDIRKTIRSTRDPSWVRISGIYDRPMHRVFAVWLHHRNEYGRWYLQYGGLDAAAVQPDPAGVRAPIPCDIRPAFATPRC